MEEGITKLKKVFVPCYDEASLYAMGLSFCALVYLDQSLLEQIKKLPPEYILTLVPIIVLYIYGLRAAIFHALVKKKKNEFEKTALFVFALITNLIAGFLVATQSIDEGGVAGIFGFWNFLNAALLLIIVKVGLHTPGDVANEDISFLGLLLTTLGVIAVIFLGTRFELAWEEVFSLSVIFASNINHHLSRFLFKQFSKENVRIST